MKDRMTAYFLKKFCCLLMICGSFSSEAQMESDPPKPPTYNTYGIAGRKYQEIADWNAHHAGLVPSEEWRQRVREWHKRNGQEEGGGAPRAPRVPACSNVSPTQILHTRTNAVYAENKVEIRRAMAAERND